MERFRGRADLDLDEVGIKQAEVAGERLTRCKASALYSSPLKRAMSTANALSRCLGLAVEPLEGLIDIDYGRWQGLSPEEAALRDGALYTLWLERPHQVTFPGGESLSQMRDRATSAMKSVLKRHPEETIALVSHKVVCKVLVLSLLGLDNSHFWEVAQDVCAINVFQVWDETPVVALLNDTCHLKARGKRAVS